ncbi:hypothetical protein Scep_003978 [Stephania cephalantha]|uniref:Uncharacterized protein n=1 Tax=Stephania cephalantha TaxID=152367 RepID=A0AAP0PWU5_9MAGN
MWSRLRRPRGEIATGTTVAIPCRYSSISRTKIDFSPSLVHLPHRASIISFTARLLDLIAGSSPSPCSTLSLSVLLPLTRTLNPRTHLRRLARPTRPASASAGRPAASSQPPHSHLVLDLGFSEELETGGGGAAMISARSVRRGTRMLVRIRQRRCGGAGGERDGSEERRSVRSWRGEDRGWRGRTAGASGRGWEGRRSRRGRRSAVDRATAAVDQRDAEELTSGGAAPSGRTTRWQWRVWHGGSSGFGKVWSLGVLAHKENEVRGR